MVLSRRNMSIESTQCGPAEVKNSDNRSIHSDSVEEVHSVHHQTDSFGAGRAESSESDEHNKGNLLFYIYTCDWR